jgi:DNA-binding winged helix-turn-helix (wHTH) protein/tetratricopeptide (TPR) repeat protein
VSLRLEAVGLRFGPFRLAADGRLHRKGATIALAPKPLALLRLLVDAEGRLVPKQEILDRLWPDEEVGEASLTSCIHGLRAALGEHGRHGRYLETVHGRGYRFGVEVHREAPASPAAGGRLRIAIVPFEEERESPLYLTEGLVADVVDRLGRWHDAGIDAIARQSAARAWMRRRDLAAIARALRADFVTTGRIRSGARELGVNVALIRSSDAVVVWSGKFASQTDRRALLAAEIAESLAKRLVELRGEAFRAERAAPLADDPRAYKTLLRGQFLNQHRTESGLRRSIACFQQALAWDPRCAAAHVALAEANLNLGWRGYVPPLEIASAVRTAASRALALDAGNAGAFAALAFLRLFVDWDTAGADEALAAARRLDCGEDRVAWMRANVETALGRFDAALATLDAALDLDPLSPNLAMARVLALWCAGRSDEALVAARGIARAELEFSTSHAIHGCVAATLGLHDEALRAADAADAVARGDQLTRTGCAWIFGVSGRPEAARTILATLERRAQSRYVSPTLLACGHAGLGDRESALAWLERAPALRCMWLPLAAVDPRFASLRGEPRFDALRGALAQPPQRTRAPGRRAARRSSSLRP